jgi:hypothetical protein
MDEEGSAGVMYNLAEHPKSIRAVAGRLLRAALDSTAAKAESTCPSGCADSGHPAVVYRVAPIKFLAASEQQALCRTLERDTTASPLKFAERTFKSVDALNSWVMDMSAGRGDDGKSLYAQCGGNCSPRYTFVIASSDGGLAVATEVLCGLARDRSSDWYRVSTALRRTCAANP